MTTATATNVRHLVFRLDDAELPGALVDVLRDEVVTCGWVRASGVLEDPEILVFRGGGPASRRLVGPVHVIGLEGSVGLVDGDVSCGLRALFARETDLGSETFAGEVLRARIRALEVFVTAFDDVNGERARHADGPWLLTGIRQGDGRSEAAPAAPTISREMPVPTAVMHSNIAPRAAPVPTGIGGAMPSRPARVVVEEEEQPVPQAGDLVVHFAFGRCEVMKSEEDRLHLRMGKDGRLKEIALEMLRVTPLPAEDDKRVWRLDRKM